MGLDMQAFSVPPGVALNIDNDEKYELHYWRKHHDLNEWICERVGYEEGEYSEISADIITQLEARLPFDTEPKYSWQKEDDRDFVAKAKAELHKGNRLFYYASW